MRRAFHTLRLPDAVQGTPHSRLLDETACLGRALEMAAGHKQVVP
jgi:hypothetical protein